MFGISRPDRGIWSLYASVPMDHCSLILALKDSEK